MTTYRTLHDGWVLRPCSEVADLPADGIPASVPGCVHTDLLAAGLIPDPYLDRNEDDQHWIGRTDWRYECQVEADPPEGARIDLVAEGLDTIADLELNGTMIGSTRNMHRSYRFDVTDALRPGDNDLAVTFRSPLAFAEELAHRLGERPRAYAHPFNFIRKMACNFGWDWGPTLLTAGIWRPLGLQTWRTARLARVRPLVEVEGDDGTVRVVADVERQAGAAGELRLSVAVAGVEDERSIPTGADTVELEVSVADVARWWPRGYGEQPLYDLRVALTDDDGVLDTWSRRIGFRSVRLETEPDEHGSAFTFVVNEVPVFVLGANWIPDDCFPPRITPERYRERIVQACEANLNLLRVWGGGLYETPAFYDACDELGMLVWQDFLFACAAYPEEEPFAEEVEAEAREAVAARTSHPSLVLWNGNNENFWGWFDWGWQDALDGRSWGRGFYLDLLPRVVQETDPTRPYWAGSPYSGSFDRHPNADGHGPKHIWDVWNERDYTAYRDYVPRFLAEFGFQGPPTFATLRRAVSDDPLAPDSPGVAHHQKAEQGDEKLRRGLAGHFGMPANFDDWHYLTQLNQARAVALAVEHLRSHRPVSMGAVVWQLNDCWPVTSWAMIDGDGRRKPLWYAVRRTFAPRLLTVQPRGHGPAVIAVNETGEPWAGDLVVRRCGFDGTTYGEERTRLDCAPRSTATIPLPRELAAAKDPTRELLVATADGQRATWFFGEDKELEYPPAAFSTDVHEVAEGYEVTVVAESMLRDLALFADRLDPDAEVDDMLVTLLPGEAATFTIRSDRTLRAEDLVAPPVLRSVGEALGAEAVAVRNGAW